MPAFDAAWAVVHPVLSEIQKDPGAPWDTQRESLLAMAEQVEEPAKGALAEWVGRLDDLPEGERAGLLGSDQLFEDSSALLYQYAGQVDAQQPDAPDQGYDEQAWNGYLLENGTAWDGTDESWPGFREWFLYYAREGGVGEPAEGLLAYLDGMPADQRVGVFARYGVAIEIRSSAQPPTLSPVPAEAEGEAAAAELSSELEALAVQIAAIAGVDQLSEGELAKILADIAAESGS
jgi:hypothetical protein